MHSGKNVITEKMMKIILFLWIFSLVEIFMLASMYCCQAEVAVPHSVGVGAVIILSNLFLMDGIISKSFAQVRLYPIVYVYSLLLIFVNRPRKIGLHLTIKIVEFFMVLLKGLIICYLIQKFKVEFAWYHFKKLGPSTALNGK